MDKILKQILEVGSTEGGTTLHRIAKLSEEAGELSSAVLLQDGYKVNKYNKSDAQINANILEEGVDVLLVVYDLLFKAGFSIDDVKDELSVKLDVWDSVVKQNNEKEISVEDVPPAKLIQNAVFCGLCGKFIISTSQHDYKSCDCGNVTVDGGLKYAKRNVDGGLESINDLILTTDSSPTEIDDALLWGTRVNGELEFSPLKLLDKDHLFNILKTQKRLSTLYKESINRILKTKR